MKTGDEWAEDADAWFYDLGAMAKRIEKHERRQKYLRKRQNIILAFVVLAFVLLAYRTEVAADRIDGNTKWIGDQQEASCLAGNIILTKFNSFLDEQIAIERSNRFVDETIRQRRILAYEGARILPLPVCDPMLGER